MSPEQISLVQSQRVENGLNSQIVFQDDNSMRYRVGDPAPKTRELTGFIDDKIFSVDRDRFFSSTQQAEFRRSVFAAGTQGRSTSDSSDSDDDDDDMDDDEDDVDDVHGFSAVNNSMKSNNNPSNNSNANSDATDINNSAIEGVHSSLPTTVDKLLGNGKSKHLSSFGSSREMMVQEGQMGQSCVNNVVTIAEPDGDLYYSQYLQATEGSASVRKDVGAENGCGFSGRKDASLSTESLRAILSDPVSGALMDDAMILPCGHSFGACGMQHVNRMKACYTCSHPVSEDSIAPNLSLRTAVQAFRREEDLQFYRSSKRRKERFDQDKSSYGDPTLLDPRRSRGVQFPFALTDRVVIKGNKRTPQRFVGREAIVTTQCLNGWYVVKTLDNAESVKLQYRSLARVSDDSSSKATTSTKISPNWL